MNQDMTNLWNALNEISQLPVPDKEITVMVNQLIRTTYKKDEYFSTPDNPSTSICFIVKGLFRSYILDRNGKEHTDAFFGENMFMSSYSGILHNLLSINHKQALEESVVYRIERTSLLDLLNRHVGWRVLLQKATEQDCFRMGRRESHFLMFDSKTRYMNFVKDYPQFKNRIQQQHIASYLGISPETLCRICANLDQ